MSKFSLLCADSAIWDPTTSTTCGFLKFCPENMQFRVCIITQGELATLFQAGALGHMEKPCQDMAFLLMAPSLAVGCEWVFRLTSVWMHPHQVHLPPLADVAQNQLLLADEGANWPYVYIRMNNAMDHMPLSSVRHIGVMTSDLPSCNACGHLHQLCMWQLLQCRGQVVCPEGLNGGLEPLMFNIKELPLWNVGESSRDQSMMDVDLGNAVCMASLSSQVEDTLGLSSRGTMEQLPLASLSTCHTPSRYLTSKTQTPLLALGAPPLTESCPQSERTEPITPIPAETLPYSRVSTPWATLSSHSPGSAQSIQPTGSKTLDAEGTSLIEQPLAASGNEPASLYRELLQLQQRVTSA